MMSQAGSQPFSEMDMELSGDDYAEGTVRKGAKHKLRKGMKKIYRHTLETPLSRLGGKKQSKDKATVLGKDVSLDYDSAAKRQFGLSTKEATKLAIEQSLVDIGKPTTDDAADGTAEEELQLAIALSLSEAAAKDEESQKASKEEEEEPLIDLLGPNDADQVPLQPIPSQVGYNPPISYTTPQGYATSAPLSQGWGGEPEKLLPANDPFMNSGQTWSQAPAPIPMASSMATSMTSSNEFTAAPPVMNFSTTPGMQAAAAPPPTDAQYQTQFYGNTYTQAAPTAPTAPGGFEYPQNQAL